MNNEQLQDWLANLHEIFFNNSGRNQREQVFIIIFFLKFKYLRHFSQLDQKLKNGVKFFLNWDRKQICYLIILCVILMILDLVNLS